MNAEDKNNNGEAQNNSGRSQKSESTTRPESTKGFDHASGEWLKVDGARIYFEDRGKREAPALVFLHGGFGTIEDFKKVLPALPNTHRIVGIDSRGHGKSTLGKAGLSYARLAKDVETVLAHLGLTNVSIIGFSDGGIVAYRLAANRKIRIEKLVTIGSHAELKSDDPARQIYSKITGESWRKKFPATYELYQRLNPEPDFDGLAKAIVPMWLDSGPDGYPGESVKHIDCPTLIVRGDEDHLVRRADLAALADQVKGAKFSNIAFAGHVAFDDQPDVFIAALKTHLDLA